MKNLIAIMSFVSIWCGINSCTSDHSTGTVNEIPDTVTFTINGEMKTFTDVSVAESTFTDTNENETIPTYNVLANSNDGSGEFIAFQLRRSYTGAGGLYRFIYNNDTGSHSMADNFTFSTTINNDNILAGTFSGPLFDTSGAITPSVTITDGSFSITY